MSLLQDTALCFSSVWPSSVTEAPIAPHLPSPVTHIGFLLNNGNWIINCPTIPLYLCLWAICWTPHLSSLFILACFRIQVLVQCILDQSGFLSFNTEFMKFHQTIQTALIKHKNPLTSGSIVSGWDSLSPSLLWFSFFRFKCPLFHPACHNLIHFEGLFQMSLPNKTFSPFTVPFPIKCNHKFPIIYCYQFFAQCSTLLYSYPYILFSIFIRQNNIHRNPRVEVNGCDFLFPQNKCRMNWMALNISP